MNRSSAQLTATRIACLILLVLFSLPTSASPETILGQHTVKAGETLYCIGRGYKVLPSAIAQANGLSPQSKLSVGQVVNIPDVPWANIPAGPVCSRQFQIDSTNATTLGPTPTPTQSPTPTNVIQYVVQPRDTLWRISRRFGATVAAIMSANKLSTYTIRIGQTIVVGPCDPAYPGLCIPPSPPDLDCADIGPKNFTVLPPDSHRFDADNDGIGCEAVIIEPPLPPACDPAYPTVCIRPRPPDLDCNQIPYSNFKVLPPDSHGFDGDGDGVGCESDGGINPPPPPPHGDPSYPDVWIPSPPPDLDCKDIPYRNFRVLPPDPHRFDGDGDGIGCEQ